MQLQPRPFAAMCGLHMWFLLGAVTPQGIRACIFREGLCTPYSKVFHDTDSAGVVGETRAALPPEESDSARGDRGRRKVDPVRLPQGEFSGLLHDRKGFGAAHVSSSRGADSDWTAGGTASALLPEGSGSGRDGRGRRKVTPWCSSRAWFLDEDAPRAPRGAEDAACLMQQPTKLLTMEGASWLTAAQNTYGSLRERGRHRCAALALRDLLRAASSPVCQQTRHWVLRFWAMLERKARGPRGMRRPRNVKPGPTRCYINFNYSPVTAPALDRVYFQLVPPFAATPPSASSMPCECGLMERGPPRRT